MKKEKNNNQKIKFHIRRREVYRNIEFKILAYFIILCILALTFSWNNEIEKFLNYHYFAYKETTCVYGMQDKFTPGVKIHFIDVGCADATFLELPDGKTMLIDCAGESSLSTVSINAMLHYIEIEIYKNREDKKLDYLVITHPDKDHYLGAESILHSYDVCTFIRPIILSTDEKNKYEADNCVTEEDSYITKDIKSYNSLIDRANQKLKQHKMQNMIYAKAGLEISGENYKLQFITPNKSMYGEDTNDYSAVIRLTYKGKSVLFMSDATKVSEKEIFDFFISDIGALKTDILKISHHGSNSSTSASLLNVTDPEICVISTRSGVYSDLPSEETIKRIQNETNAKVYQTQKDGNIIINLDKLGSIAVYTSKGSFEFIRNNIYVKYYYLVILLASIIYVLIFRKDTATRD